ncbi:MAG TPA: hypothetical protein VFF03_05145 [Rhodocyclaceae bacterium]|nr:hypothetical protein [Rhodocyclaceae bacterium]
MSLTRADWPHYQREAIIALVALVSGLTAVGGTYWLNLSARQADQQAEAVRGAAQETLANVENEQSELQTNLARYRDLVDRSIIGNEKRLNWHETLKEERDRLPMAGMVFSLAPQAGMSQDAAGNPTDEGLFRRRQSTMKLAAAFQRETVFVDFLEASARKAHALPIVRSCRLTRAQEEGQPYAGILAECLIDWTTLERATADGEGGAS